mmetsp:Transcript_39902/g.47923  ORF Transcript_39902/g.47923 Transcript_39902/m.47923 type:complete len:144 (-) Transcript_39902:41-472(-)
MDDQIKPSIASLPVTIHRSLLVNQIHSEIMLQRFSDRTFVLITQIGKVGNLLSCSLETSDIDCSKTYHVSNLLGNREDSLLGVYARAILEKIVDLDKEQQRYSLTSTVPLLLGIALKKEGRGTEIFQSIIKQVISMYDISSHG